MNFKSGSDLMLSSNLSQSLLTRWNELVVFLGKATLELLRNVIHLYRIFTK